MQSSVFNSVGSFVSSALDFNKATLSGSLDVIVVRHDDGSLKSTPFHVRFGKLKVFRTRNKRVRIICNGEETGLYMKLGDAGEAYFEEPSRNGEEETEEDLSGLTDGAQSHGEETSNPNKNKDHHNSFSTKSRKSSLLSETSTTLSSSNSPPPQNIFGDMDPSSSSSSSSVCTTEQPPPFTTRSTGISSRTSGTTSTASDPSLSATSSTGLKSLPNLEADGSITLDGRFIGTLDDWRSCPTTSENSPSSISPVAVDGRTASELLEKTNSAITRPTPMMLSSTVSGTSSIKPPDVNNATGTDTQKPSRWSWMWGEFPQKAATSQKLENSNDNGQASNINAIVMSDNNDNDKQSSTTCNRSQSLDRSVAVTNSPKRALSAEASPRQSSSNVKARRIQDRLRTARLSRGRTGVLGSVVSFLAGQRSYLPEFSDSSSDEDDYFLSDKRRSFLSSQNSASKHLTKAEPVAQVPDTRELEKLVESRRRHRKWFNRRLSLSEGYEFDPRARSSIEEEEDSSSTTIGRLQHPLENLAPIPAFSPPWHASDRYRSSQARATQSLNVMPSPASTAHSRSIRRVSSASRFEEESLKQQQQQQQPLSGRKSRNDRSRRSFHNSSDVSSPPLPSFPSPPLLPLLQSHAVLQTTSFDNQFNQPQRTESPPPSTLSSPASLRRCASSSPQSFSAKKKAMKSWLSSTTEVSPLRTGAIIASTIITSSNFSDVIRPILLPNTAIKRDQGDRRENQRRKRRRALSLDIFTLTRAQLESCHDAFGLWALRMTTATRQVPTIVSPAMIIDASSSSSSSTAMHNTSSQTNVDISRTTRSDTISSNVIISSHTEPASIGSRRISKRERFLGWIPVIGPLVIPKDVSRDVDVNKHQGGDTISSQSAVGSLNAPPLSPKEGDGNSPLSPTSTSNQTPIVPPRKSLVPTADQLRHLGKSLRDGANRITFEVEGSGVKVESRLYVWSPHSKIVISDVDGTITKSDVLGHIFFFVGRDWTHRGVAQLYSSITKNGYNIVYLTSRAIGQTDATRVYLQNIKQFAPGSSMAAASSSASNAATAVASATSNTSTNADSFITPVSTQISATGIQPASAQSSPSLPLPNNIITRLSLDAVSSTSPLLSTSMPRSDSPPLSPPPLSPPPLSSSSSSLPSIPVDSSTEIEPVFQLPPGPVITSPDRLFTAFTREVILRRPQEFKIAALRNILSLFPEGSSPIIAGFGNRDTDVLAYRAVGVPNGRIFIISPTGEVQTDNKTFQKSYAWINSHVDNIFPFCKHVSSADASLGVRTGVPLHHNFTDAEFWKRSLPKLSLADEAEAKSKGASASSTSIAINTLTTDKNKVKKIDKQK